MIKTFYTTSLIIVVSILYSSNGIYSKHKIWSLIKTANTYLYSSNNNNNNKAQRSCPAGWGINEELGFCYKTGVANVASSWERAKIACEVYSAELYYLKEPTELVFDLISILIILLRFSYTGLHFRRIFNVLWVATEIQNIGSVG